MFYAFRGFPIMLITPEMKDPNACKPLSNRRIKRLFLKLTDRTISVPNISPPHSCDPQIFYLTNKAGLRLPILAWMNTIVIPMVKKIGIEVVNRPLPLARILLQQE